MPRPRDPETFAEWQEAADSAYALLLLEAARGYGLVKGGPDVDVERCRELIDAARREGVVPSPRVAERIHVVDAPGAA